MGIVSDRDLGENFQRGGIYDGERMFALAESQERFFRSLRA
jgi:hypothetical protein